MNARLSIGLLLLLALAFPGAASPGAASPGSARSGSADNPGAIAGFTVGPESAFPLDVPALAEGLCQGNPPVVAPAVVGGCKLVITTNTGGCLMEVFPESPGHAVAPLLAGESKSFSVAVVDFNLAGVPVESSCGPWEVDLDLDPERPQPVSSLIRQASEKDGYRGVFASVLELRARLHLRNVATGRAAALPLKLRLGLAGTWALVPGSEPGAAGLLLFAARDGDEVVPNPARGWTGIDVPGEGDSRAKNFEEAELEEAEAQCPASYGWDLSAGPLSSL